MVWWVVNKQINKDSLVSLPMKNFLISEYLAKLQAKNGCLMHFYQTNKVHDTNTFLHVTLPKYSPL